MALLFLIRPHQEVLKVAEEAFRPSHHLAPYQCSMHVDTFVESSGPIYSVYLLSSFSFFIIRHGPILHSGSPTSQCPSALQTSISQSSLYINSGHASKTLCEIMHGLRNALRATKTTKLTLNRTISFHNYLHLRYHVQKLPNTAMNLHCLRRPRTFCDLFA